MLFNFIYYNYLSVVVKIYVHVAQNFVENVYCKYPTKILAIILKAYSSQTIIRMHFLCLRTGCVYVCVISSSGYTQQGGIACLLSVCEIGSTCECHSMCVWVGSSACVSSCCSAEISHLSVVGVGQGCFQSPGCSSDFSLYGRRAEAAHFPQGQDSNLQWMSSCFCVANSGVLQSQRKCYSRALLYFPKLCFLLGLILK